MILIRNLLLVWLVILLHAQLSFGADIPYQGVERINNGGFEDDIGFWYESYYGDMHRTGAKDGNLGLRLTSSPKDENGFAYQLLRVPTRLDAAVLRFDYRVIENDDAYDRDIKDHPIRLAVFIGASTGWDPEMDSSKHNLAKSPPLEVVGYLAEMEIDAARPWGEYRVELEPSLIAAMQKAHDDGKFLFITFFQRSAKEGDREYCLITHIDNLSMVVDGTQQVPDLPGEIAYYGINDAKYMTTVEILNPNTRGVETLWTYPSDGYSLYGSDIDWNPDSSQLAFTSTWESFSSVLNSDILIIGRDGSGLRKLTSPMPVDPDDPDVPRVTLTGKVSNISVLSQSIWMKLMGSNSPAPIASLEPGEIRDFEILDVPVLDDPKQFSQVFTLIYSNDECTRGFFYHAPNAPVVDGRVDIGTIPFVDMACTELSSGMIPHDLTWKHDGTKIYFRMQGFHSIPVDGSTIFSWDHITPNGSLMGSDLAWSPVDDRYLFTGPLEGLFDDPIQIAEPDGTPRKLVDNNDHLAGRQEWLPDGSGFIYIGRPCSLCYNNFYHYDFETGQTQMLTYFARERIEDFSVSPDGRYIVFEQPTPVGWDGHAKYDLWVLDRLNPVEMWPLTDNGRSRGPSWSGPIQGGNNSNNGADDNANGGDDSPAGGSATTSGGGGCFVEAAVTTR